MIGELLFGFIGVFFVFLGVNEVDRDRVKGVEILFDRGAVSGVFVGRVVISVRVGRSGGESG
jgi:hypothetical protein